MCVCAPCRDATNRMIEIDRRKRAEIEARKAAELAAERAGIEQWKQDLQGRCSAWHGCAAWRAWVMCARLHEAHGC